MPDLTRLATGPVVSLLRALLTRMPPGSRSWLARQIMQDRFDPATRVLAGFFEQGLHAWHNRQYAVELNGEATLLTRLRPFSPAVVFDVGANIGDWSLAAYAALPDAQIHAFEIADRTAAILRKNMDGCGDRLIINQIGLGQQEGEITLYLSPQNDTAASTVREAADFAVADQGLTELLEIKARVITGDSYLRQAGIRHVDLLKIDVEGAEFQVLHGFSQAFDDGAIGMVQFEYGKLNLSTREFLGDFWKFFTDRGFTVGKLYREGVAFKDYDVNDEDFIGPNFIACRSERSDIIEALRCPPLRVG